MNVLNQVRDAILHALPADTSYSGSAPPAEHLYVPPTHLKALRLESQLVVGTRGVGKSVWTAALYDNKLRQLLGPSIPELDSANIRIGYSERPAIDHYPDAEIFADLMQAGSDPYTVWRAVIIRWIAGLIGKKVPHGNWKETVIWVKDNPEEMAKSMSISNKLLSEKKTHGLILFDALDRLSNDWHTMDQIVRELLRIALWLKPYSHLHSKIFLREDQLERPVTDFPDASKLLATKADLSWARHDLHGLLWQYLLNGPSKYGETLRGIYQRISGIPHRQNDGPFLPDEECKRETPKQRALFEALAGPWMGRDRRRGIPYVWAVGHLADGQGRTSPRSFIAAIRQAAEDTLNRYPDHQYALHYESIKRGVQKASEIRVNELAEDYPWVRAVLNPLNGLTVPVEFDVIQHRWEDRFPNGPQDTNTRERLPPQHVERGWNGVRADLLEIGIFEERKDGRIDMPDLYRVGFGLGRRGGVKPKN